MITVIYVHNGADVELRLDAGINVAIDKGHLFVYDTRKSLIAAFAPGNWRYFMCEENFTLEKS